jgi:CRP/FNR family cyclic AMP-dependent transcriptional regulator
MAATKGPQGKILKAIVEFLRNISIFDTLEGKEIEHMTKHMKLLQLNAGDILFHEKDKGDYVCFIVEGALDVLKQSETGRNVAIATLLRGRSIGEMSIIDDFPRSATVRARTKARLIILTRDGFNLILQEYPKIGIKVLKGIARLLSQNLRKTSSRLVDYMLPLS